jgi:AcrR family transcriptional regulator
LPRRGRAAGARLGVTKGSFYWHFPSRDALLASTLERWEQYELDKVFARLEAIADPKERLRELFRRVARGQARTSSIPNCSRRSTTRWSQPVMERVSKRAWTRPRCHPLVRRQRRRARCAGRADRAAPSSLSMLGRWHLLPLNPGRHPPGLLPAPFATRIPSDVARVEHLTFVCTRERDDAGPNNHWMAPGRGAREDGCAVRRLHARPHAVRGALLHGPDRFAAGALRRRDHRLALRGRQHAHDDPHGRAALARIEREGRFVVKGLHSIGELDPERRFIMHFPEELTIKSYGSGYGGNALLGKKCHALRIASWQARSEGWLAEHMLIVGVRTRRARPTTSPPRSPAPAARPTWPC